MNNYKILKFNNLIKNHRVKFFGLWLLSILDKRYLGIFLDPVFACNLKCKMCYFSDDEFSRKSEKGIFKEEELEKLANVNWKNALKLQIGCGAEPSLFKHNTAIIKLAKKHGIPYVSMVTNGNALSQKDIVEFSDAGLNEIILSMHGVHKESYEEFMTKGNFEKFHGVLKAISDQKSINPKLNLRINYTFNKDNFFELKEFFDFYGHYDIDTIQLRPIDKIGNTKYNDFSLKAIENDYLELINVFKAETKQRNITFLHPETIDREEEKSLIVKSENNSSYLNEYTYCYVSPNFYWKPDFDWKNESFLNWKKRKGWHSTLIKNIFISRNKLEKPNRNMLNYSVTN